MAGIGSELKDYLKTKSPITNLVGSGNNARIYKDRAKQGVDLPYIVYEVFRGSSAQHLQGITGIASNRIQVDAYAVNEEQSYQLAELIRLAPLQMYRGMMNETFVHDVNGDIGYEQGSTDPVQGSEQRHHWTSRDYIITYREAT